MTDPSSEPRRRNPTVALLFAGIILIAIGVGIDAAEVSIFSNQGNFTTADEPAYIPLIQGLSYLIEPLLVGGVILIAAAVAIRVWRSTAAASSSAPVHETAPAPLPEIIQPSAGFAPPATAEVDYRQFQRPPAESVDPKA